MIPSKPSLLFLLFTSTTALAHAQDADTLWREFTRALMRDEITAERIQPYHPSLTEPLLGYLKAFRAGIPLDQWGKEPEAHRVGDLIHYITSFPVGADSSSFCFTLRTEAGQWYFVHLENVFIRLDKLAAPPVSTFPDLPESNKAWMREEKYWSFIVHLYNTISKEKEKEYALNLLKDGQGYFLEAKAWVPFVAPRRAFVLYTCWEQSVLRGNQVTLEELSDTLTRITMTPAYFQLYSRTAHLKSQIAFDDYRQIFETIWRDRAEAAGWRIAIELLNNEKCLLRLW
ncbi:MAG: hypothetical protein AB1428_15350 [Bacteroidota bacterium]